MNKRNHVLNSCHFWSNKLFFLQILYHSSVSWDINPLYFFWLTFYMLSTKEPLEIQIWWNFMWAVESLKFCTLMGLFALLSKLCKVSAKKVQNSYLSWHWKGDAKFKEELTFGFKYDMRNLVKFHPTTPKSENFLSVGSFCP